jgi:class 3 adenylate cyclase/ligand-binding sensor domain-containing protein/predicted metal-dependent HD superfamily phosphohydrolase
MLKRLLFVVSFFAFAQIATGQLAYRFSNFNINDGLSQSSITTILQDRVGTIWVGTQDGINRFDGQEFQIFTPDNTKGLESGFILSSHTAKNGFLWFGTSNGLTAFDPKTESFKTYFLPNKITFPVEEIAEDTAGNLYLATTTRGLAFWNKKTKQTQLLQVNLPSKHLHYIKFLTAQTLLISTEDKGVFTYNIVSKQLVKCVGLQANNTGFIINDAEWYQGAVFLLGTTKGLWFFNIQNGKCAPFLKEQTAIYGEVAVSDIYLFSKNEFFVATEGSGLLTVSKQKGKYNVYQSKKDIFQKNALQYDEISELYGDKTGAIWVATLRGLSCFNPFNQGFLGVGPTGNLKQGLPSPSVWGFAESPSGESCYIASDYAVTQLDRATGVYRQFYINQGDENASSVLSVAYLNPNTLLVGCTDGLYQITHSPNQYEVKKIRYKGIENPSMFEKVYRVVAYDKQSFFLGTKGGVLLYDSKAGSFTPFSLNLKQPNRSIKGGVCKAIYKGIDGTMYFGTSEGGLSVLKKSKNQLQITPYKWNTALTKASKDYILSIYQDKPNELWLGTTGSGILQLNTKTGQVTAFSKKDGLPNNFIYGILSDKKGNLWLSTNRGIAKFSRTTKQLENYTEVHGLMSNEFNTGAYFSSVSGDLFFGGIAGYNFFNPIKLTVDQTPLTVSFLKFKFDDNWLTPADKNAPFKNAFAQTKKITLRYNQRSFTVRFVASDLMDNRLITYKYRLVGSNENEVLLGNNNEIRFNSLSPGSYYLEVYAKRSGGKWNTIPASLEIEIAAPFWGKWWFWAIVAFVLIISGVIFVKSRINLARRDQVRLEMKIVERTREIRNQSRKIEQQKQLLEVEKNKVDEQQKLLQIEKDKSEKLLRNIIPESTAEELKNNGRAEARAYKMVSVLFTDFVGFTKIAEGLKPTELVNKLDIYFRKFDEIIVRNNLEKIKTIGDAYMCAGGVPLRNATNPIDAVLAALQIQDYMQRLKHQAIANGTEYWDLRLGINTGEVTAGVIGTQRFAYDIWGATVNQAQRMEMMGEPGKVTISGATFKHIEPYFECSYRGKVQSKSKGWIEMYTVERIKPELSINGEGLIANNRLQQIVNLHQSSRINYYKAEKSVLKILEKGLSKKLHYHCIEHTKDVVRAVERYALMEDVTDEGLFLLKSAATYHDAGFVESYEDNEYIGARMAEEMLPKFGYSQAHIDQIKALIFVTQIPHTPTNKLEEIMCDADLDYLGRADFHEIADKLRRELREHGKLSSDRAWDETQVAFLSGHTYFTKTAIASRQAKKEQNLQEVKERLLKNEYAD